MHKLVSSRRVSVSLQKLTILKELAQLLGDTTLIAQVTILSAKTARLIRKRAATRNRKTTKAGILSIKTLRQILLAASRSVELWSVLFIAFVTGSRIGEVLLLQRRDLTLCQSGILVSFGRSKTNMEAYPRSDHNIIIPNPPKPLIECLVSWAPPPTEAIRRFLKRFTTEPVALNSRTRSIRHCTFHSFKRTAANMLIACGNLDDNVIATILKHKEGQHRLSSVTVGYTTNLEAVALRNGTHLAVQFLMDALIPDPKETAISTTARRFKKLLATW